jgi:acetoin:2,6-dichlorophenolindophenol oxidoreductase subunit alpha
MNGNRTALEYMQTLGKEALQEMLRRMFRIRLFEEKATSIRLRLIAGALHNSIGQEGEIVGACMALRNDDYMTGNHRSHGHPIGKGVAVAPLMAELLGKETGVCRGKGGSMHLADFRAGSLGESGIVGASIPTATGAALSARLRGTDQVCLSFFGDGAVNCGPFHESLNLAAVWALPVIFVCENNGYAICSTQVRTTAVANIADRAAAYAMPGCIVDGQDALAVCAVVSTAVARARSGAGPTLIEAKTYRYYDHQDDFDFPPYRAASEVASWRARDPIEILIHHLLDSKCLLMSEVNTIKSEVVAEIENAVNFAQSSSTPDPAALLEDVFA